MRSTLRVVRLTINSIYIAPIILLLILLPHAGNSLETVEFKNERFEVSGGVFKWSADVTNNAVMPLNISFMIHAKDANNNKVLSIDMEKFFIPKFKSKRASVQKSVGYGKGKIVTVETNVYITTDASDADDYEFEKSGTGREPAKRDFSEDQDRSDQRCRDARSALTRLADSYQMKYEVYQLCPPSYMTSSKCGKLSQQLTDLREDLDRAKRKAKSACR